MKTIYFTLIFSLTFLTGCGAVGSGNSQSAVSPANGEILRVYSDVQERTARGVLVASQKGTSAEFKQAVDDVLTDLFDDARAVGDADFLSFANYTVYALPNCELSPESRVPSFRLRADNYNSTPYDVDPDPNIGRIFAAEYVMPEMTGEYVICYKPTPDANTRDALRFGPEHLILYFNRRGEYEATKTHINGGHPLISRQN